MYSVALIGIRKKPKIPIKTKEQARLKYCKQFKTITAQPFSTLHN